MKKRLLLMTTFILTIFCFNIKEVDAYSVDNYKDRNLCAAYELAGFHSDGVIDNVGCYASYSEAKNAMVTNGADDLAIMTMVDGKVKIIDANVALLDLSVNPETLTYFYENAGDNNRTYTYMDTGSLYGGVDGAHIETVYNNYGWNVKVKIGNFTGWIRQTTYEIVPITWVKSSSSYTVTSSYIKHNYVNKIQETYTGTRGSVIGPKPSMLDAGTYYSYDGHYFYKEIKTMIKDYKAGNFNNSVNKDKEYFNYYMYLSNHTRTNYSSINIDKYIRENLGYTGDVYGSTAGGGRSKLYGMGTFFYHAQEAGGANALLSLSLSRNETGNGKSPISINKNNGFGLDAVDSSPGESAKWYATFSSSILGYANKWITYGYAHARDWRYFGPQFGDKGIGMNVKYASDTYWSEKMAANYYAMDAAFGLQDHDYYQLGVVVAPVDARADATPSSKFLYTYPEKDDAVVIVGEKEGYTVKGDATWYKIVSDLNLDDNFNELPEGSKYNWNSYAYVPAAYVKKINTAKDGYKSPNDVFEYQDKNYTYDLMIKDTVLSPKIGLSVKETSYYYDSTLTQVKNQKLLNNRYVIIHAIAYDEDKKEVSYLVTSDYMNNDEHWVPANTIKEVAGKYAKVSVDVPNTNAYTWVNYNTVDSESTKIGGLYKYAIVPILETKQVDGYSWYKIPYNLSGTSNEFGWTLATAQYVTHSLYTTTITNQPPVINASNKTIVQGQTFDAKKDVTATDPEDGNLTSSIQVVENNVNNKVVGTYKVKYQVTDSSKETVIKEITVTVTQNQKPSINAKDKTVNLNSTFNALDGVTATDPEDGNITNIKVTSNNVNTKIVGTYQVTYQVTDSFNQTVTKTITITVKEQTKVEANGLFNLNYIKTKDNKLLIQGYETIYGIDNNLNVDIKYTLIFINIDTKEEVKIEGTRVTNKADIPKAVYSPDGKDYTYSWFNAEVDVDKLPVGNYQFYAYAETDKYYVKELVNNNSYKPQATKVESTTNEATISNNYDTATSYVELKVRDEAIADKNSSYIYNQYTKYTNFEFSDNYLYLRGNSYSYGMNLSKDTKVTRNIIFEDKTTYKKYTKALDSITNGNYQVFLPVDDKLDKTKAWFDKKIDISDIPVGEYVIYITTSSNITDYSEFTEKLGRSLDSVKKTINGKNYSFSINLSKGNRIEMKVTK